MAIDTLPREQGATRRWDLPKSLTDPFSRQSFNKSVFRAKPLSDPRNFGKASPVLRRLRLANNIAREAKLLRFLAPLPVGRVLTALDLLTLLVELLEPQTPGQIPGTEVDPGSWVPSKQQLLDAGWLDLGWLPENPPADYTLYVTKDTGVGGFYFDTLLEYQETLGHYPLTPGNYLSQIAVGEWITQVRYAAPYPSLPGTKYHTGYHMERTETSVEVSPPAADPVPAFMPVWWGPSPNDMRWLRTAPEFAPAPASELLTLPARALEVSADGKRVVKLTPRAPPGPREKEKKVVSRSAKVAVALFNALDQVSELSELVSVFYEALPKKLRRDYEKSLGFRWVHLKKGGYAWVAPPELKRGLIDKAGQYGIGGGDWKARLVWTHWRQLDPVEAMKGLMNNATQDFVHGQLHKRLPRNIGHGVDPAVGAIEKGLQSYVYL